MELSILIVDDSPAMRAFIRRVLELSGLELGPNLEASNGEEALRFLEDHWVDAVLTDINYAPHGRRGVGAPNVRTSGVVLDSGRGHLHRSDREPIRKMLTLGAKGYIAKPFAPEALREELEHSLGVNHAPA